MIARGERDQHFRSLDYGAMGDSLRRATFADAAAVDSANTAWISALIDEIGWPERERVGEEASHAAWLLVQHADRDPEFQARMLPLATEAAERGEASWREVALLTDRVRVKQGRPQVYGTQYQVLEAPDGSAIMDDAGRLTYLPPVVEDPERLDERRAAVGLEPWIEYERRMAELQGREPVAAPRSPETGSIPR